MADLDAAFRVGFVGGVMPDTWARRWRARFPRSVLDMVPLHDADGVPLLHSGELHMCFVRQPVEREGLHLIPLYDEQPVVVASREHPVSTYDTVDVAELADETLLDGEPPRTLVERAAYQQGLVILPLSLARLHHRKDVAQVPVTGVATTNVGLAWRRDLDDERSESFIGVVRGRTPRSSR